MINNGGKLKAISMLVMPKLRGNVRITTKLLITSLRTTQSARWIVPTSNTGSEAPGQSLQILYHIWNSAFTAQTPADMGDCDVAMGTQPPPARQVPSVPHTCASFKVDFTYFEIMEVRPFRF